MGGKNPRIFMAKKKKEGKNHIQQKGKTTKKPGTMRGESMSERNGIKPMKMRLMNKNCWRRIIG